MGHYNITADKNKYPRFTTFLPGCLQTNRQPTLCSDFSISAYAVFSVGPWVSLDNSRSSVCICLMKRAAVTVTPNNRTNRVITEVIKKACKHRPLLARGCRDSMSDAVIMNFEKKIAAEIRCDRLCSIQPPFSAVSNHGWANYPWKRDVRSFDHRFLRSLYSVCLEWPCVLWIYICAREWKRGNDKLSDSETFRSVAIA